MKPQVDDWVAKAEGDFVTTEREARARKTPNFDASCFHAQQCAEKYLKARLLEAGIGFPKTHDLVLLLDLVLPCEPLWETWRDDLSETSAFAVLSRYPGDVADRPMAMKTIRQLRRFRKEARAALGLPD
jgi:HEPN domain-containing protein